MDSRRGVSTNRLGLAIASMSTLVASVHAGFNFTCTDRPQPPAGALCNRIGALNSSSATCVSSQVTQILPFPAASYEQCRDIYAQLTFTHSFGYDTATHLCYSYYYGISAQCYPEVPGGSVIYSDRSCVKCAKPANKKEFCAANIGTNLLFNGGFEWSKSLNTSGPWAPEDTLIEQNLSLYKLISPGCYSDQAISTNTQAFQISQIVHGTCASGWHFVFFNYRLNTTVRPLWTLSTFPNVNNLQIYPDKTQTSWQAYGAYVYDQTTDFETYGPVFFVLSSSYEQGGTSNLPPTALALDNFYLGSVDPHFVPVKGTPEIFVNSDFHTGTISPPWTQCCGGPGTFTLKSPGLGSDQYALYTQQGAAISQPVSLSINQHYLLSFEYIVSDAPQNATYSVQAADGGAAIGNNYEVFLDPSPAKKPRRLTVPFVPHVASNSIGFAVNQACQPKRGCNQQYGNMSVTIGRVSLKILQVSPALVGNIVASQTAV